MSFGEINNSVSDSRVVDPSQWYWRYVFGKRVCRCPPPPPA